MVRRNTIETRNITQFAIRLHAYEAAALLSAATIVFAAFRAIIRPWLLRYWTWRLSIAEEKIIKLREEYPPMRKTLKGYKMAKFYYGGKK